MITSHAMTLGDERADENESRTFLRVAESVLANALSPLKAREIVDRGIDAGLFGDHALGRTPEKSMQARLSTEILASGPTSQFVRTGRGKFTLRSKLGAEGDDVEEYVAVPRALSMPIEDVLCAIRSHYAPVLTFQGLDTNKDVLLPQLLQMPPAYIPRSTVEGIDTVKQFVTYVIVQCGHRVLSFERSYLSRAAEFLRGSKCIGFGGHVSAADVDIFSSADRGISGCARRELYEELKLPAPNGALRSPSNIVSLVNSAPLELIGVLNDDSSEVGRRHVAIVYRLWLEDWGVAKTIQKGESSIRSLKWIDLADASLDLSEFEYWSQLCIRKMYPSSALLTTTAKISNQSALQRASYFVVSGRVGSGKSETAKYIADKLDIPVINSGKVVQELLGIPPLSEIGRSKFQQLALDFIRHPDGPRQLADQIISQLPALGGCVIDGIRQLETYNSLKFKLSDSVALIYINTPPDIAFDLYRARETDAALDFTYKDFLSLYDAPVEVEISRLGRSADAYIYNSTGLDQLRRAVDSLIGVVGEPSGK